MGSRQLDVYGCHNCPFTDGPINKVFTCKHPAYLPMTRDINPLPVGIRYPEGCPLRGDSVTVIGRQ